MAGDEDEAEEVVADGVVESGVGVGRGLFEGFEFAGELFVFALGDGVAAEEIDGAAFGRLRSAMPRDYRGRWLSLLIRRTGCGRIDMRTEFN